MPMDRVGMRGKRIFSLYLKNNIHTANLLFDNDERLLFLINGGDFSRINICEILAFGKSEQHIFLCARQLKDIYYHEGEADNFKILYFAEVTIYSAEIPETQIDVEDKILNVSIKSHTTPKILKNYGPETQIPFVLSRIYMPDVIILI